MAGHTVLPFVMLAALLSACATERTWLGEIGDSACRSDHFLDEHANIVTPSDCTLDCVGRGLKFVLVTEGRVYALENQDHPTLRQLAGQSVQLSGYLKGETITVTRAALQKLSSRRRPPMPEHEAGGLMLRVERAGRMAVVAIFTGIAEGGMRAQTTEQPTNDLPNLYQG